MNRRDEIEALAKFVWNSPALAEQFMSTPHPALDGKTPRDVMLSEVGLQRVEVILKRLFYGMSA